MDFIKLLTGLVILEHGLMTSKKVVAKKHGLIKANLRASTKRVLSMVQVNIHMPTDLFIKVIGQKIQLRVLELIRG